MEKGVVYVIADILIEFGMTKDEVEKLLLKMLDRGIYFGILSEEEKNTADKLISILRD